MNPKTRINTSGKAMLNTTADGLLIIDCKLALINDKDALKLL
jgi:hypothetical protein